MGKRGSRGEATVELLLCITFGVKGSDTGSGFRLRDNEKKKKRTLKYSRPSLQQFRKVSVISFDSLSIETRETHLTCHKKKQNSNV